MNILNNKKIRYGSYSIILTIFVIAIVVVLNIFINMIPYSADMTENKKFSIGDKTQEILDGVEEDITIHVLADEVEYESSYAELYRLMQEYAGDSNIDIEFTDVEKNPGTIKRLDPDNFYELSSGDIFIVSGDKKKKLVYSDFIDYSNYNYQTGQVEGNPLYEQTLTGAILYVSAEDTPKIYLTTNHGEVSLSEIDTFSQYIERNNYDIEEINLLTVEAVPEDADMIFMLSPAQDIKEEERMKLVEFLEEGKSLMVFLDPFQQDVPIDEINRLLVDYNMEFNKDTVTETNSDYYIPGQPNYLLLDAKGLETQVFAPYSRSIKLLKSNIKEWITTTEILYTSDQAVSYNIATEEETKGKAIVGLRTLNKGGASPARVVAFGNSTLISDGVTSQFFENVEFVINQINWALGIDEDQTYIPAKETVSTRININQLQATTISLALIIIIPIILFGIGVIVYVRRKNL